MNSENSGSAALPDFIHFGRAVCGDLEQAERREWWLSNGLGAYAAGTVAGALTRRYHGLLIAPVEPPLGRRLLFAKADATLLDGDRRIPLFTNRWGGGTVSPRGHVHIESFYLHGRLPVWRFALGAVRLEQRIWLEQGAHTVYLAWRLEPGDSHPELSLQVRLLVDNRDHHHETRPGAFTPRLEAAGDRLEVVYPEGFTLYFRACGGAFQLEPVWIENFALPLETERGLPDRDAHLGVGRVDLALRPGVWSGIVAGLHADAAPELEAALQRRLAYDGALLDRARPRSPEPGATPDWIEQLTLAADSFLFARPLPDLPEGESIIAGYPWFGDWGRDTMIALPGLTLATGRLDSARRILQTFARFVERGMLPNVFPGAGERPEYNTVDAALWYFEAWRAWLDAGGDRATLAGVFPVLEQMIDWHIRGTRYGVGMDPADGQLRAGEPGSQLTWMDARVAGKAVTPRVGKPVEINALWHNALSIMADFARRLGRSADRYDQLAAKSRLGFQRFIRPAGAGLFDVLDGPTGDDLTCRPNQILAVSLPYSPLERAAQRAVVDICGRKLLTSYGLRSLAPDHPDYRAHYRGGVQERDGGYHQGPVWAWLLGHYALAEYRVFGDAALARSRLEPVRDHLLDAGLGAVSEIFDGDAPHIPRGAPAQAWSVGCVLAAWRSLCRLPLS